MKRLFAFVLVLTVILGSVVLPVWAAEDTTSYSTGSLYAIPDDATQVKIGDDVYNVIRSYDDWAAAFPTTSANMGAKYILAADIDFTGRTLKGSDFLIPSGAVIEGNGFGLVNILEENGLLAFQNGDEIVIRNMHFGTKNKPMALKSDVGTGRNALICAEPAAVTYWENCQFYGNATVAGGTVGVVFGYAKGEHTFKNCSVEGNVLSNGGGDPGLLVGGCGYGTLELHLDGVNFYGYVGSNNNAGTVIGWAPVVADIVNCNNYATVEAAYAGGFIGNSANWMGSYSFENCVNYGAVNGWEGTSGYAGGFVGQQRHGYATFTNCVNLGNITGIKNTAGFCANIGREWSAINCLNAGKITGTSEHTGGFGGWGDAYLENCVNIGEVIGGVTAANFVGKSQTAEFKNCYGLGVTSNGTTGAIVGADYSDTIASGCKFLSGQAYASWIGLSAETDSISQADAMAMLEEQYPDYVFVAEKNGTISLNQTALRAVQNSAAEDGKFDVRVLGTITTLNQKEVGFTGTVSYTKDGAPVTKNITLEESGTASVHKTVLAGTQTVTATDLLGAYIYTLKLVDLPATGTVTISLAPVSVLLDDTQIVGNTTTLIYENGAFVGTDSGEETTVTTLTAYTEVPGTATPVNPDADVTPKYNIPADATTFEIEGVQYQVIRTFAELKDALAGKVITTVVTTPFGQKENTKTYYDIVHLVLANTIDCGGATIEPNSLWVGAGSVIDGNNYTVYNYSGYNIFSFADVNYTDPDTSAVISSTDVITVRNINFGCADQPIIGLNTTESKDQTQAFVGMMAEYPKNSTEWDNVNLYGKLYGNYKDSVTGGFIGKADANHTFKNCTINGLVASSNYAASLIGYVGSSSSAITIENCVNNAEILGWGDSAGFVASFVQKTVDTGKITIKNSTNNGDVRGATCAGGLVGNARTTVEIANCVNNGDVIGGAQEHSGSGGIVSWVRNTGNTTLTVKISNTVNNGNITGISNAAGGIVGAVGQQSNNYTSPVELSNVVNNGIITGDRAAGGIVGVFFETTLMVDEALNTGAVYGQYAAGVVGQIYLAVDVTIENAANIATATQRTTTGTVANIVGLATVRAADTASGTTAGNLDVKKTFAFGKVALLKSDDTGMDVLLGNGSTINGMEDNCYFEYGNTTNCSKVGIDLVEPVATLAEAATKLAEVFTAYNFTVDTENNCLVATLKPAA